MEKYIPSKHSNSLILVTKYNWPVEAFLKGHSVVLFIDNLDCIPNIMRHKSDTVNIHSFVYENDLASLETIEFNPDIHNVPLTLIINRLGKFSQVHHKIAVMRNMNISVFFTGDERIAARDAQILSSLGIHSGISLPKNASLGDSVMDLMTYNFYGTMPHAPIEPFSTLEYQYDGNRYVSPALAQFHDPTQFVFVDKEYHLAFSKEEMERGEYFDQGRDKLANLSEHEAVIAARTQWQEMFIQSHPCTFCPAFRVCMGYFSEQREKGRCQEVMNELLESIEFSKKKNQNNHHLKTGQCRQ